MAGPSEYELMLHDAEVRIARLKALYEQYFQGIEKLEPVIAKKEVDRLLDAMRKQQPRNTALRFRTQMLFARYSTYLTYWQRITRQIEEGTFKRDITRLKQKRQQQSAKARQATRPEGWEIDVDVDVDLTPPQLSFDESDVDAILGALGPGDDLFPAPAPGTSARDRELPSVPPPPSKAAIASMAPRPNQKPSLPAVPPALVKPKPPAAKPVVSDEELRMRRIYETYLDARKRNNERVDTVKYESWKQSMDKTMPKLRQKYGDRPIDFEVVVQNGKVGLKPKVGA